MTGEEVKKIRHVTGMTQEEFSKSLGVSLSLVQKWETGNKRIAEYHSDHIKSRFNVK